MLIHCVLEDRSFVVVVQRCNHIDVSLAQAAPGHRIDDMSTHTTSPSDPTYSDRPLLTAAQRTNPHHRD